MADEKELTPGKFFPADMKAPSREDVIAALAEYGIEDGEGKGIRLIDSSHSANDIRLNYIIDKKWVLRFCNAPEMTENRMRELNRLIGRYSEFGLRCPAFITDGSGNFFHERNGLLCYLAEYVDLPTAYELELPKAEADALWNEVLESVAAFAERYKGEDLSETMGMYSLFDLNPFDRLLGKDEKQQNLDNLIARLRELGEDKLAERLNAKNGQIREKLKAVYRELPRCVFQGDENFSNVLVDAEHHLAGLIDFNLAGTEVVVNQFANLGGGFDEEITEPIGAKTRLRHALADYAKTRERLLSRYNATEEEKIALEWYTWIALTAGWPQVCFFLEGIKNEALRSEILELISLLAELPCP